MSEKKINEKKKVNPMMIMMLLMLVIIVALAAGLGYYLILNPKNVASSTKPTVVASNVPEIPPLTYPITKDFIVNLTDTDAKRLIKLNITLAFTSTKLSAELLTVDSFIRDAVISVLREKKAADFNTTKNTDDLKKQLITRINPYLKAGKISDIYFNDILVQ